MIEERNKETLARAIAALPEQSAPNSIWASIDADLLELEQFDQITTAAKNLPTRFAPAGAWQNITADLDNPLSAKIRSLLSRSNRRWVAAAAFILLTAGWLIQEFTFTPDLPVTVYQEGEDASLLVSDWDTQEELIAEVISLYRARLASGQLHSDREWLAELLELNEARDELKHAMDRLGRDAQMIHQLASIERERASILKKMAQQI
ncbi:MAG: hypothetical protein HRU40_12395 [Saprospiraceae bacterium]|nr:hypothetical protein [Saprospiraceae bacterium]